MYTGVCLPDNLRAGSDQVRETSTAEPCLHSYDTVDTQYGGVTQARGAATHIISLAKRHGQLSQALRHKREPYYLYGDS